MLLKNLYILFILFSCCAFTGKKVIRIATLDWTPFISPTLPNKGWVAQVAEAAFAEQNIQVEWLFYPWQRSLMAAEVGKVDAVYPTFYSAERASKYDFSDAFRGGLSVIVGLKSSKISYKKDLHELSPYSIGVVRGYVFGQEFDEATYLNKTPATDDEQNIRKLINKRVDLVIINYFVFHDLIKNSYANDPKAKDIVVIGPPVQPEYFHVAFTKNRDMSEFKEAFNIGLAKIKKNKTFNYIMKSAHLNVPKEYINWFN